MKKLTGESLNITEENLKALEQLFPEAFEEGKIDFAVLRQLLGDFVDDEEERYSFKWNGKGKALRLSQTPSLGTLRPCKEESKDWDTTQNLYIEGDNLEVLKLLQKSYYGKVKMIYIDPPYNTGGDFVYKDDFRDNIENYKRITGQVDGEGHHIDTNTESNGRFHTDWLNMMYPRLRLARNLLSDDGVIFISIDDNEQENLKKICDEVFGEDNLVNVFIWNCSTAGGIRPKFASKTHEYILCYAKAKYKLNLFYAPLSEDAKKMYNQSDTKGLYRDKDFVFKNKSTNTNQKYLIRCPDGELVQPKKGYIYRFIKEKFDEALSNGLVTFKKTKTGPLMTPDGLQANWNIYIKKYLGDAMGAPSTLIPKEMISIYNVGTQCVQSLFDDNRVFDNVKPFDVITYLNNFVNDTDSIILDFFSGSATTAHAVMQLNAEDGGHRKFIMVQLPEPTAENSEAAKAGYKNICEIGKERIRRAGEKIKAEAGDKAADLDIGFKVFKLDSSNLQKWNPRPKDLMLSLQAAINNFMPGRTEFDVVYEILLKMGLNLDMPIEERQANGETVYIIGGGALMICLGEHISLPVAEEIVKLHKEYDSELWQVVFRDTGFASDMDKTNIKETLKTAGLDEDSFVCV